MSEVDVHVCAICNRFFQCDASPVQCKANFRVPCPVCISMLAKEQGKTESQILERYMDNE